MSLFTVAIKAYQESDYGRALELFEEAGRRYGADMVEANILMCRKALNGSQSVITGSHRPRLDPATRYMLAAKGKLTLSEAEQQACLDEYAELTSRKSEDVVVTPVNPIPGDWPKGVTLAPLPQSVNDFMWNRSRKPAQSRPAFGSASDALPGLTIIIPTFNRGRILDVTLACLVNQQTRYSFEVVVADDGSKEPLDEVVRRYEPLLDIKYVRQKDYGFQVAAVRNLGMRIGKYDFFAFLDCDMAPCPKWVESFMDLLVQDDDVALIGPRKYVDTSTFEAERFLQDKALIESLPEVRTNNSVAGKDHGEISIDWRLDHFRRTENLRLCNSPFRFFAAGNVAFARKWLQSAGWFDEEFSHWGGEDIEFAYRLFRHGCFFRAVGDAMAYHQEPPGKENETDRAAGHEITVHLRQDKVPYIYRRIEPLASAAIHTRPLVSLYIPAYNCADQIVRCVDSALNQTVVDLEVCICDDGSTDGTLDILERNYGQHPRVRFISKANGGIATASNAAVRLARGYYIGQLDSDDYLEPDAVELCLKEFFADRKLACVYTTYRNVNPDGSLIKNGYNWPVFSREKLTTAMIAHHFRMFTSRAWYLTTGFDETIANAVDYDMYLKLSEVGPFKHVNKISYNRTLHGENTSIKKLGLQKQNHFKAVNESLRRQNINSIKCDPVNPDDDACRKYSFSSTTEMA